MTTEWSNVLQECGALTRSLTEATDELQAFIAASSPQLSDLSNFRIFEITGTDATAFLQGQFCNDISLVSSTQAQMTGYCTPKGRLLALPTILGFEDGYRMLVPADVAEAFVKRLSMFVMRSDVSIKALEDWVAVGITAATDSSMGKLETALGALPVGSLSVSSHLDRENPRQIIRWHDDFTASAAGTQCNTPPNLDVAGNATDSIGGSGRDPVSRARYLQLAPVSSQRELWSLLDDDSRHSSLSWRLADVSAAIPSITQGITEAFVPQMMNLQLINALSFTKGCYPGQEIVARMQYLGKLKRHMRVFNLSLSDQTIDINETLKPGSTLNAGADNNAGIIVDAIPCSSNGVLVLAVTKVVDSETAFELSGMPLAPCASPYELPTLEVA